MSDYDPRHYDQYGNRSPNNANMNYDAADGRGPYILLAILVVIGVLGGILYFNHAPRDNQQAQTPAASEQAKLPTPPALPGNGSATPANPGGATAPSTTPAPSK
jgi:hypothetical protein